MQPMESAGKRRVSQVTISLGFVTEIALNQCNAHTNSNVEHVASMVYCIVVESNNTSEISAAWITFDTTEINWASMGKEAVHWMRYIYIFRERELSFSRWWNSGTHCFLTENYKRVNTLLFYASEQTFTRNRQLLFLAACTADSMQVSKYSNNNPTHPPTRENTSPQKNPSHNKPLLGLYFVLNER